MALELCRASRHEQHRRLPGDNLVPRPMGVVTHAITIEAPPWSVWPWLVQMGSGRAGWYSYDRIDNGGEPSASRIIPELQHLAVGDVLPWLPGARDGFEVREIVPDRSLILVVPFHPAAGTAAGESSTHTPRASWALILHPLDRGRTRLIARGRIARDWLARGEADVSSREPFFIERVYGLLAKLPRSLLLPVAAFGHYLMQSRMLRGIKRRAERGRAEAGAVAEASGRATGQR